MGGVFFLTQAGLVLKFRPTLSRIDEFNDFSLLLRWFGGEDFVFTWRGLRESEISALELPLNAKIRYDELSVYLR